MTFELARLLFDDPNAIDRLDLDEPDEDRDLITKRRSMRERMG
ncbi:MAG: hypothetical protein ABSG76_09835 [Xanthobacteraceae bacterium]